MTQLALKLMLILTLVLAPGATSFAQEQDAPRSSGPRKQIATIIFSGLAGAVLGLSTLSFYGRPQDRLSNIAVGFAIGIIIGAGYTTFKAATRPEDFYNRPGAEWSQSPEAWRLADQNTPSDGAPSWGWSWQGSF